MRTGCCKTILFVFVLLAMAILAAPAFAQSNPPPNNCLLNQYQSFNGSSATCPAKDPLQCTANDVAISQVPAGDITILGGGINNPPRCFQGSNFQFIAVFDIFTNANATNAGGRDNVGLYFAQPGNPNPYAATEKKIGPVSAECGNTQTGSGCIDNIIAPLHGSFTCPGGAGTCPGQFGSDNYHEFDAPPDTCGDTSSSDFSPASPGGWGFGANSEGVAIQIGDPNVSTSGFQCPATLNSLNSCTTASGTTGLLIPYCTSWQIPGGANQCILDATFDYNPAAVPANGAKCNCTTLCLPVQPISITVLAAKACTTAITTGAPNGRQYSFSGSPLAPSGTPNNCDEGIDGVAPAGNPTYGVAMDASASIGGVILDQICDDVYGTIASAFTPPTCPAGTKSTDITTAGGTTTCGAQIGQTFASGNTGEICTFTVPALGAESAQLTDHVKVYVHSSQPGASTSAISPNSNAVTVFSDEANSSATAVKSVVGPVNACVTVRYQATVTNTSGSDETEFLSTLTDTVTGGTAKSLTACGTGTALGTVVGTTCNQPTTGGCGTLAGTPGVPFPTAGLAPNNGSYSCNFDMQFCNTAALDASGCFTTPSDAATATLNGDTDNGETAVSVSATSSSITANVCITAK
jgi:hypothetical protein